MKTLKTFFAILVVIGIAVTTTSAQQRTMPEIHSMMVYNFMKYIHWPPTATSGDFVIGVVGDKEVFETLNKWYGTKSKGAQKIIIKQFNSASEISDCHVLYIGKAKSSSFADINATMNGKPTLMLNLRISLLN